MAGGNSTAAEGAMGRGVQALGGCWAAAVGGRFSMCMHAMDVLLVMHRKCSSAWRADPAGQQSAQAQGSSSCACRQEGQARRRG